MTVRSIFLAIASLLAGLAVAAGAGASHALKSRLTEKALMIWDTGTKYQMYHALALLLVVVLIANQSVPQTFLIIAGIAFTVGIILFSGSLYGLSLTGIKWLGAVTPIGGLAFLIGWGSLVAAAFNWR